MPTTITVIAAAPFNKLKPEVFKLPQSNLGILNENPFPPPIFSAICKGCPALPVIAFTAELPPILPTCAIPLPVPGTPLKPRNLPNMFFTLLTPLNIPAIPPTS